MQFSMGDRSSLSEQQWFEQVFDKLQYPVVVYDIDARFYMVNQAGQMNLNKPKEAILGQKLGQFVPEMQAQTEERLKLVIQTQEARSYTDKIELPGGIRWFFSSMQPVLLPGVDKKLVLTISYDITEQKSIEIELKLSRNKLNLAVETAGLGIWQLDLATEKLTWNETMHEIYEISHEEFQNNVNEWRNRVFPDDLEQADAEFESIAQGQPVSSVHFRIRTSGGEVRHLLASGAPFYDERGDITALLGINLDITPIKKNEEFLQAIFDNSPSAIIIADDRGVYTRANQAAADFFGYELDKLVGLNVRELLEHDSSALQQFENFKKQGKQEGEFHYTTPAGAKKVSRFTSVRIGTDFNLAIHTDITSHYQAEQERLNFEKQLLQTQKLESLGVLAGGIAHDFNNILMGIMGHADLAANKLQSDSPAFKYIGGILKGARQAAELIKQMLAYAGKGNFQPVGLDLNQVVVEILEMLKVSISKKVSLNLNFFSDPVMVKGDLAQLRQVIMNLVINASESLESGGHVTITTGSMYCDESYIKGTVTRSLIDSPPGGTYSFVEVSDNGQGIDPNLAEKIFDPFFSTKETGRGLGLSAVQGIVSGHKGFINLYSEPGKGTTFKVLLPANSEQKAPAPKKERLPGTVANKATILVVDDEEQVRNVCRMLLEEVGHTVLEAVDGEDGITVFKENQHKVTCVLLDMTMPKKNGAEVFREIRKIKPSIGVILMSGYNEQDATQQFLGKGLAGFLQKPFRSAELYKKVKEMLSD